MANLSVSGIVRITRDAEIKKTSMGTWFSFGICAYRKNVKDGKQSVDFFDVDLYQKEPYKGIENDLKKGRLMHIENGQLKNDQYTLDGKERSKVRIYISSFEMLGTTSSDVPEPPRFASGGTPEAQKPAKQSVSTTDLGLPKAMVSKSAPVKEDRVQEVSYASEFAPDDEPPY